MIKIKQVNSYEDLLIALRGLITQEQIIIINFNNCKWTVYTTAHTLSINRERQKKLNIASKEKCHSESSRVFPFPLQNTVTLRPINSNTSFSNIFSEIVYLNAMGKVIRRYLLGGYLHHLEDLEKAGRFITILKDLFCKDKIKDNGLSLSIILKGRKSALIIAFLFLADKIDGLLSVTLSLLSISNDFPIRFVTPNSMSKFVNNIILGKNGSMFRAIMIKDTSSHYRLINLLSKTISEILHSDEKRMISVDQSKKHLGENNLTEISKKCQLVFSQLNVNELAMVIRAEGFLTPKKLRIIKIHDGNNIPLVYELSHSLGDLIDYASSLPLMVEYLKYLQEMLRQHKTSAGEQL